MYVFHGKQTIMLVPNPLGIEWMAGMISRVLVQTSAKKTIKRVEKICIMTTEAGEVISWKNWHF